MNFPLLIVGPPGSGKTTRFIEELSTSTSGKIAVLEPVQKIVQQKQQNIKNVDEKGLIINDNIKYINYAQGLSTKFFLESLSQLSKDDIIVVDEAHTIFFTEFRNFDVKNIDEIIELYKDKLVFITATPYILELYLQYKNIQYDKVEYPQRLSRKQIKINIIPTKFANYITPNKLYNYDITLVNNIKTLKKLETLVGKENREFSFIYSYYNEINNLLFEREIINDNKWIGTNSLGQGIDKFVTIKQKYGKILFDGNNYEQVPDIARKYYDNDLNKDDRYYNAVFKCMAQNIIQTDRFRVDLDSMEIDVIYDIELKRTEMFKEILEEQFKLVYKNSDIQVNVNDGLYANKLDKFGYKEFKKCIDAYDPAHSNNTKDQRTRFLELLDALCNPVDDEGENRTRHIGNFKTTLKYFQDLYQTFYTLKDKGHIFFDNINERKRRNYVLQKSIVPFINYLIEFEVRNKALEYLRIKEAKPGEQKEDPEVELFRDMGYIGETLLEILFSHYDVKYSIMNDKKRENSPIQLMPKYLRTLVIVRDIDVSACHIVAMIKKIMGDDYLITPELINKIYSFNTITREETLEYLKTFGHLKDLSISEIENAYLNERGLCKQAMLSGLNRLSKYKNEKDYSFIKRMVNNGIESFANIDLRDYGEIGYYNGIKYEQKWLGPYNAHRGVIFRIADGLGQVYGNTNILGEIKETIINEHKIMMSEEDIMKNNVLQFDKNLDYFINQEYDKCKDTEITDEMMLDSFVECIAALEKFRVYIRKGKFAGKNKGKAIGKAIGKAVNIKKYVITADFIVKKTGTHYKQGTYEWKSIPKDIPASYRQRYLLKAK